MTALRLEHLHQFFRQISEAVPYAAMLGGSVEATPLNQWAIIGLHARQTVLLSGNMLTINGLAEPIGVVENIGSVPVPAGVLEEDIPTVTATGGLSMSADAAMQMLFEKLETVRQKAQTWPEAANASATEPNTSPASSPLASFLSPFLSSSASPPLPASPASRDIEPKLPMRGGLLGALGYQFYQWCDTGWQKSRHESRKSTKMRAETSAHSGDADAAWPELLLCEFEDWVFLHLETGVLTILSRDEARQAQYQACWQAVLTQSPSPEDASHAPTFQNPQPQGQNAPDLTDYLGTFEASFTPDAFETAVHRLQQGIRCGELYQANLSMRFQKNLALDAYSLFEQLCRQNPSPFSGFFKWPDGVIVSNSPERLVQTDASGQAQTRPIAGTRGRGSTRADDERIGQTLLDNEKERAEHLMLVDLARNDLGRVCETGSVRVSDLLTLERYSHVTHLVSNVTGTLAPEKSPWALLQSLFPGGTITGCPKVRCVDLLSRVESVPRGFYTGSLGYMDAASPAMDWNILIRSVFLRPLKPPFAYQAAIHVGAGIVHDAVAAHEYRECLRKATASLNALAAVEITPSTWTTSPAKPG